MELAEICGFGLRECSSIPTTLPPSALSRSHLPLGGRQGRMEVRGIATPVCALARNDTERVAEGDDPYILK